MAKGIIFQTPTTKKEADNPEVLIQGYGRMMFDQLKRRIARDHEGAAKFLKMGNFEGYAYAMNQIAEYVEAVQDIESEMNSPKYKRMKKRMTETPANVVGGGHVAGLGVGSQGEPGLTRAQQRRYKRRNQKDFKQFINR